MIKAFIKWLFGKEYEAEKETMLNSARVVLEEVKAMQTTHFVRYERIDPATDHFLHGIQPILDNKYMVSWLNEHKAQCHSLMIGSMANGDDKKVLLGMAQVMLVESLLKDIDAFKARYIELLERSNNERA